jgi:hypothetical protein
MCLKLLDRQPADENEYMATSDWKVVGQVALQNHHWPSKTRHTINGKPFGQFSRLEIVTHGEDAGVYLLHIGPNGRGTDTWHENPDDAFHQAEFEFGVRRDEWHLQADISQNG